MKRIAMVSALAVLAAGCSGTESKLKDGLLGDAAWDAREMARLRTTGEPCTSAAECLGGVCLTTIAKAYPNVPPFVGGYCSAACISGACSADEACVKFRDAAGATIGEHCLLLCGSGDAGVGSRCRLTYYYCSTANVCFPK